MKIFLPITSFKLNSFFFYNIIYIQSRSYKNSIDKELEKIIF